MAASCRSGSVAQWGGLALVSEDLDSNPAEMRQDGQPVAHASPLLGAIEVDVANGDNRLIFLRQ